jgi:hypothetical protein
MLLLTGYISSCRLVQMSTVIPRIACDSSTAPRRFQFGLRALLIGVAACAIVCSLLLWALRPYSFGVGERPTPVVLRVVDGKTGLPVMAANVQLCEGDYAVDGNGRPIDTLMPDQEVFETATDSNGQAQLTAEIRFCCNESFLTSVTYYNFHRWLVRVSAEGYKPFVAPLSDYTGRSVRGAFPPPVVKIQLEQLPDAS